MSNYLDDIEGEIKGFCALHPVGSRWSTVDGCIHVLMVDAIHAKINGTFDKNFGAGSPLAMATTPAPAPTVADVSAKLDKFITDFDNNFENVNSEQNSNTNAVEDLKKTVEKLTGGGSSSPATVPTWAWFAIGLAVLYVAKKVFKLF